MPVELQQRPELGPGSFNLVRNLYDKDASGTVKSDEVPSATDLAHDLYSRAERLAEQYGGGSGGSNSLWDVIRLAVLSLNYTHAKVRLHKKKKRKKKKNDRN